MARSAHQISSLEHTQHGASFPNRAMAITTSSLAPITHLSPNDMTASICKRRARCVRRSSCPPNWFYVSPPSPKSRQNGKPPCKCDETRLVKGFTIVPPANPDIACALTGFTSAFHFVDSDGALSGFATLTPSSSPESSRSATPDAECLWSVKVATYIFAGRIYSSYTASLSGRPPCGRYHKHPLLAMKLHTGQSEEAAHEAWIYEHLLRSVQGDIVPKWFGIYADSRGTVAALLEYAGEAMSDHEASVLSPEDKLTRDAADDRQVILDKYKALHRAGVVHVSHKLKHWLRPRGAPVSQVRLIDFGSSYVLRTEETAKTPLRRMIHKDVFDIHAAAELASVRAVLDYY